VEQVAMETLIVYSGNTACQSDSGKIKIPDIDAKTLK